MNDWIEWSGGECPVPDDTIIDVQFRNEVKCKGFSASRWAWEHIDEPSDIVAYRVVK